ncbi:hypothetical protein SERLADRAFT_415848 [Serpula lacrymans var. lacrymans S7.9]|uniref:Uncharacterized protein n=1 Tax=Serpula lacrymans var. lacrymans (strain S7.9) TaxID=578457 RepID=F8NW16_SERL9|nr:uncharacterized protein SERLADRAFT_415848 [Serpula lacrymans var. lacrymans S7.9]EGO24950.1 hypothetical protein SERLADRAFT_415848 [Serpula lacrymans var. lacrymans S7.9]
MDGSTTKLNGPDLGLERTLINLSIKVGFIEAHGVQHIIHTLQPRERVLLDQIAQLSLAVVPRISLSLIKQEPLKLGCTAHVDELPNELLAQIFEESKEARWRFVAVNTPRLWTTVHITPRRSLLLSQTYIERSGCHLVDIILDYRYFEEILEREQSKANEKAESFVCCRRSRHSILSLQIKRCDAIAELALSLTIDEESMGRVRVVRLGDGIPTVSGGCAGRQLEMTGFRFPSNV